MTLVPGARLGAYDVLAKLGEGGMGEVYRARDAKLHRDVAIKVLPPLFASDPDRLARFEREARILAAFNHPNIATVYGLEEQGTVIAIVMELVEGETLEARIRAKGRLSSAEVVAIARQLVEALDAAHERAVVHRDLKPANVKLTPDGVVKVLDFGLAIDPAVASAEAATLVSPVTQPGLILGTAAYMSPEQARGQPLDKRADIWAFGCVLYEMLTGSSPFAGESISDVIAHVLEREPDLNALPASTPRALVALIQRCLQKDPTRRLRDIADARRDFDEALAPAHPVGASPERRARLPWLLAVAALVSVGGAAAWLFGRGAGGPALSHVVRLTNSPASEFSPAISPDNKWVAYYSEWQGRSDVWVKFLNNGSTINLTSSLNLDLSVRGLIGGLSISPDGSSIAFASRTTPGLPGYDTWVIPAPGGGVPRKLLPTLQAMQWSPDGKQIVCVRAASSRGDALVLADADGGNQRELVPAQGGRHLHWPAWSPDQKWIYFISSFDTWQTGQSEIYRVSAAGGKDEPVITTNRRAIYPAPFPGGGLIYAANPDAVDLSLWWSDGRGHAAHQLTIGVGEYSEARLSADGSRLVATVTDTLRSAIYRIPTSGAGGIVRVTDGFGGDVDPSVDPRHDRLVFASARSGQRNLWVAKTDGTDLHPLTREDSIDERPAFSHDGQQIAFVSDRGGRQGIWVVSVEGGAPRLLTHTRVLDTLTWSRDDRYVLYAIPGGDMPQIEKVGIATGRVEHVALPTPAVVPAYSPAADVLAYLDPSSTGTTSGGRMALTVADAQGRRVFESTTKEAFTNGFIAWSPDGRRIAGVRFPANAVGSVWIVDPSGVEPTRKLMDLPVAMRPHGLTWSADGASLLVSGTETSSDIVLFDVAK